MWNLFGALISHQLVSLRLWYCQNYHHHHHLHLLYQAPITNFFRLCSCRFDSFGMLVLLLVKCLPRMSFMTSIINLGVSKMQLLKPEMKPETKTWNHEDKGDSNKTKKNSNRTIFKPEMAYLQVSTRTYSTFLISHHTNPARFLLQSNFFLIQLLQKKRI